MSSMSLFCGSPNKLSLLSLSDSDSSGRYFFVLRSPDDGGRCLLCFAVESNQKLIIFPHIQMKTSKISVMQLLPYDD